MNCTYYHASPQINFDMSVDAFIVLPSRLEIWSLLVLVGVVWCGVGCHCSFSGRRFVFATPHFDEFLSIGEEVYSEYFSLCNHSSILNGGTLQSSYTTRWMSSTEFSLKASLFSRVIILQKSCTLMISQMASSETDEVVAD